MLKAEMLMITNIASTDWTDLLIVPVDCILYQQEFKLFLHCNCENHFLEDCDTCDLYISLAFTVRYTL